MPKRTYGTGAVLEVNGVYYGKWRVAGRQVKRRLGPVRQPSTRDGLTKTQAEARLRELVAATTAPPVGERVTLVQAGRRLLAHLETLGRKRSTLMGYESGLRVHVEPFFGDQPVHRVDAAEVEAFMAWMRRSGRSPKTTLNALGLLHSIFDYAIKRGWASANPCKLVDKPRRVEADADVHFLEQNEIDALLAATPDDALGGVERAMYLAAVMTGMRQGELLALRWSDIDWAARRVRVRRNFVRGEYGTPKSKRSTRSIPLADHLAGELHAHWTRTEYAADEDLVFAHPHTGKPMDRSSLLKRFKRALRRGGVRAVRFHDLRHTFGTRCAASGVAMRTLQEWMGHRDFKTTLIYADYMPGAQEADLVDRAFGLGTNLGTNLSATGAVSDPRKPL